MNKLLIAYIIFRHGKRIDRESLNLSVESRLYLSCAPIFHLLGLQYHLLRIILQWLMYYTLLSKESTMKMTEKTADMLVDNINDLEEPFSPVMELTAKSVTGCLTNVLQSAAGSGASDENQPSPEA